MYLKVHRHNYNWRRIQFMTQLYIHSNAEHCISLTHVVKSLCDYSSQEICTNPQTHNKGIDVYEAKPLCHKHFGLICCRIFTIPNRTGIDMKSSDIPGKRAVNILTAHPVLQGNLPISMQAFGNVLVTFAAVRVPGSWEESILLHL